MAKIDVSIDSQRDLTVFKVRGDLTAEEIMAAIKEYRTRLVLWDTTEGSVANISSIDFQKIARMAIDLGQKRKEGKTAFVGVQDIDFGLGRMYEAFAGIQNLPYEYRTFRSIPEAEQWLGVDQ